MRTRFKLLWVRFQRAWLESELRYIDRQIEKQCNILAQTRTALRRK